MRGDADDHLTELVNDERARRAYAEKELAVQREETRKWRQRARRAETAARFSIRLPSRPTQPPPPPAERPQRRRIVFPSLRAGLTGAPAWVGEAFDCVDLSSLDEAGLAALDLVLVGGSEAPDILRHWLDWPARQPLVAFEPRGELAEVLARTRVELVVGEGAIPAAAHRDELAPVPLTEPSQPFEAEEVLARIVGARGRTLRDTAGSLLEAAGIDPPRKPPGVSAVVMTKRPHRVRAVIEQLARMEVADLHVEVGTHGFEASTTDRQTAETHFGDRARFRHMAEGSPLGRCLNLLVDDTTTELWAKIDDDDHYGPLYLEEAVLELGRTGADLVGKLTHHLHDSRLDRTYLMESGNEYRYTGYALGATFVARRHTWEEVRFPHRHARVDSTFVRGMNAVGMSIYSTSRFEYCCGRGDDEHTWHADESLYAARGRALADGFAADRVFLPAARWTESD